MRQNGALGSAFEDSEFLNITCILLGATRGIARCAYRVTKKCRTSSKGHELQYMK